MKKRKKKSHKLVATLVAEPETVIHKSALPSLWVTDVHSFQNSRRKAITLFYTCLGIANEIENTYFYLAVTVLYL